MSTTADTQMVYAPAHERPQATMLQYLLLWAVGAGGAIVLIEPSPYEVSTLAALIVFTATGLRLRLALMPLILMLFVLNLGYSICSADLLDQTALINWVITSWYMAITCLFFAMVLAEDTANRIEMLRRGLIFGALITSLLGIAGYFKLVPGSHELFTLYSRAKGGFKDPNVLSAYLILPMLFVLQKVVTEKFSKAIWHAVILGILALALLLAFSRAAWGQFAGTAAFTILLTFMTSASKRERNRIVVMSIVAVAGLAVVLLILLSMDSIATLFKERASFKQDYDGGHFGRFGRHLLGAQMALDFPWGIGPLQFNKYFPEDTHNSYLNAFMSGGWISGITYPALVFSTAIIGLRYLFLRTPWQQAYIAVYAAYVGTVAEAFIIDVDHWRHFWLMLGLLWGMFVASGLYERRKAAHS